MTIEQIGAQIEAQGYGWDVGRMDKHFAEARVWKWPYVKGRYRNPDCSARDSLIQACANAGITIDGVQMPEAKEPRK